MLARRVVYPVRSPVADGFGGPIVEEGPANTVRACGHAEPAALTTVKRALPWTVVVAVDAEKTHLVTPLGIGFVWVYEYAESFVEIGDVPRGVFGRLPVNYQIGVSSVVVYHPQRGFPPSDAVIGFRIPDSLRTQIPDPERAVIFLEHRSIHEHDRALPRFVGGQYRISRKFPGRLDGP